MQRIEAIMNYLILDKVIKEDSPDHVKELIAGSMNSFQMQLIATAIYNKDFEFFSEGDYFKTVWNEEEFGGTTNLDQLHDIGLYKDGYIYGQVIASDDWGNDFNPYYHKMKCILFLHNDNLQLSKKEKTIPTYKLVKINKEDIKHFNYGSNQS